MNKYLSVLREKYLTETPPLVMSSTITAIHMLLGIPQLQHINYSIFICTVSNINHYFTYCPHYGLLHTVLSHFYVVLVQKQLL